jgi:hypothetical protein
MKEKIDPNMHVIDIVLKAMQECGVPPRVQPIRGGTDGAQLSFRGLPCPKARGSQRTGPGLPRGLPFARASPPIAGTKTLLIRACGPAVWSV